MTTQYELWVAARDLMQGRRLDAEGQQHGWMVRRGRAPRHRPAAGLN